MSEDSKDAAGETQLRLELNRPASFDRALFVVSPCNRDAVSAIDSWPDWPGGCLVLVGPEGVGKSHLAHTWALRSSAFIVGDAPIDVTSLASGPILLEDADRRPSDTGLFHLMNRADTGTSLLMTARTAPRLWPSTLPDLRSRLNALVTVAIDPPDDVVLEGVLMRFFRDRNIRPDKGLISYLLRRIERSVPAALEVVSRLATAADAAGRGVTRSLAREILDVGENEADLPD